MLTFNHSGVLTRDGVTTFVTTLDRDCEDFTWVVGHEVEVGGKVRRVIGVELVTTAPPFIKGEPLGLRVAA